MKGKMPSNPPEVKNVSVSDIGDRLRLAREKKGLTIEQAQKQTHIHSTVLSALENGRCDDILTPNYVKSFLKEYSSYLGFDHQAIVSEYLTLHPELKNKNINTTIDKTNMRSFVDLGRIIRIVGFVFIILAVVGLVLFAGSKVADNFKKTKPSKSLRPAKASKTKARTKAPVKVVVPRRNIMSKNVPFTMTLKVKNPVMVQLKKDGVLIFKRVLPKGTEEIFAVNNAVNMFVGRAESIEIIVNGKSLGAPGRGVIRDIEVTSNGLRIR
jgi:transcriptional regulator with XRE-family HTH domain